MSNISDLKMDELFEAAFSAATGPGAAGSAKVPLSVELVAENEMWKLSPLHAIYPSQTHTAVLPNLRNDLQLTPRR